MGNGDKNRVDLIAYKYSSEGVGGGGGGMTNVCYSPCVTLRTEQSWTMRSGALLRSCVVVCLLPVGGIMFGPERDLEW